MTVDDKIAQIKAGRAAIGESLPLTYVDNDGIEGAGGWWFDDMIADSNGENCVWIETARDSSRQKRICIDAQLGTFFANAPSHIDTLLEIIDDLVEMRTTQADLHEQAMAIVQKETEDRIGALERDIEELRAEAHAEWSYQIMKGNS